MEQTQSEHTGRTAARRPVAVVTDSATALTPEMASANGLSVAAMEVTVGDRTYVDGPVAPGGSLSKFYDLLRTAERVPTTSAPKPDRWMTCFRDAAAQGETILCITLAANLSASYDSARVAVELAAEELPDTPIRVMNSNVAAGSQALVVLEAARHAAAGASLGEVEAAAARVAGTVRLIAYLDTLEYIWKGGRVPRIAVWASTLLDIKPVLELVAGRVNIVARPRSRRRANERLLADLRRDLRGQTGHVNVMHADAEEEAQALMDRIRRQFNCAELFLTQFHPFMGAHTGPGLVGVAYWVES